jgi:hypothetical protein
MARNLLRLWQNTGEEKYRDLCVRTVKLYALTFRTAPASMPTLAQCLDELLDATGGDVPTPKVAEEAPKVLKESADVVKSVLKLGEKNAKGEQSFTLSLTVSPTWHIYANPVGDNDLLGSQTDITLAHGMIDAKYPKGKPITDSTGAKYSIYEGTVEITGTITPEKDQEIELRIKLIACKEGKCLLQSVVKVKP